MLELDHVWRTMDSDPPVNAVRDVSLTVRSGEWWSIMGPSGSGKSTLLNLIGCLDRPTQGVYRFLGEDAGALSDLERAGLRAASIGFVFQQFHLLSHRSAVENVMLSSLYLPRASEDRGPKGTDGGSKSATSNDGRTVHKRDRSRRREQALDALARVGLANRADFLPTRMSGGERQRVAIARALMNDPPLLLCDEPTGNLDSVNTESVLGLLSEIHEQGQTIIVVTHESEVAARGELVARMMDGAVVSVAGIRPRHSVGADRPVGIERRAAR